MDLPATMRRPSLQGQSLWATLMAAQIISATFNPQQAVALTTPEIVAKAKPTVVAIERIDTINGEAFQGTGWFYGDGKTVVTNAHILKGTYNLLKVYSVATGKEYTVDHVNYLNPKDDVAALTVRQENRSFLAISDIAPIEGSNVTVIGNPKEHYGTVTTGIVSALRGNPKAGSVMQISAPVSHGSSGSPVLNDNGEVIGMIWGGDPQNDAHDLNYAVPQEILKSDLFGISALNIGGPLAFATPPSTQTVTPVTPRPPSHPTWQGETPNPEPISKGMLTRLANQIGLTAAQQAKAKPIIDKYVVENLALIDAATLDRAAKKITHDQLKQQYDTAITGFLTPAQKKKYAAAEAANKAQLEAARAKRKAAGAAAATSPTPKK
jgi:S1-C subfamily serine protease